MAVARANGVTPDAATAMARRSTATTTTASPPRSPPASPMGSRVPLLRLAGELQPAIRTARAASSHPVSNAVPRLRQGLVCPRLVVGARRQRACITRASRSFKWHVLRCRHAGKVAGDHPRRCLATRCAGAIWGGQHGGRVRRRRAVDSLSDVRKHQAPAFHSLGPWSVRLARTATATISSAGSTGFTKCIWKPL
jgi:hypothetical protein